MGLQGTAQDITERKSAEEVLHRQAHLLDLAFDAIFVTDQNGLITYWNLGATRRYGWSPEEALGKNTHNFLKTVFPQPLEEIKAILLKEGHWEGELKHATRDGSRIIVASRWSLQRDEHGNPASFLEVNNDITDQRYAEEALREREAELSEAQRITKVGNWKLTGNTVTWSEELHRIFGHDPGLPVPSFSEQAALFTSESWRRLQAVVERATKTGILFELELEILCPEGMRKWINVCGEAVRDEEGRITALRGTAQDITERLGAEEKLRQSEERFRTMANSIPQLAWIAHADGFIYWYNQRWYEYTGTTPEQMEGWGWQSVHDPLVLPKVLEQWKSSIATGQPFDMEFPLRGADGLFRPFLTRVLPLKDEEGHVVQWFGTNTDIAEHKRAEQETRRLNADLELQATAMQSAANSIIITGADGSIQWVNHAFTRLTGYSAEEVIGQIPRILKSEKQETSFYAQMWRTIVSGQVWHGELVNKRKDGRLYTEEMTITPVVGTGGSITHFIAIKQDVTNRKQTEAALREAAENMTAAQRIAHFGSWELDLANGHMNANALRWSDECYRVFGFEPRSVPVTIDWFFSRIPSSEEREQVQQTMASAVAERTEFSIDHRVILPNGEIRHIHEQARIFFEKKTGRPLKLVGTAHDITLHIRAQEALQQSNEALELKVSQRTAELQKAKERAEAADRLKSDFLASMSHELRTPLNALIGFSEILIDEKAGPVNAKQKDYLTEMLASGHHLLALINDILDLAKLESGKITLTPERFLLGETVAEVADALKPFALEKELAICQEISPVVDHVYLDKQRFKQILYNLLSNAVKFTNPGGRVTLTVSRREKGTIELKVQDTGIGIRPEDFGRLFVKFQQLDASAATRACEGTGLGLALTREMVELQGGTVNVESQPGHGSTFTVLLPQQRQ